MNTETNTQPKYELLKDQTITINGHTLCRIRALRDFGAVKAGELGGYIESEANLSHEGTCWVAGQAKVFDDARVRDDAQIEGKAMVYDEAVVGGDADLRTGEHSGDASQTQGAESVSELRAKATELQAQAAALLERAAALETQEADATPAPGM